MFSASFPSHSRSWTSAPSPLLRVDSPLLFSSRIQPWLEFIPFFLPTPLTCWDLTFLFLRFPPPIVIHWYLNTRSPIWAVGEVGYSIWMQWHWCEVTLSLPGKVGKCLEPLHNLLCKGLDCVSAVCSVCKDRLFPGTIFLVGSMFQKSLSLPRWSLRRFLIWWFSGTTLYNEQLCVSLFPRVQEYLGCRLFVKG